MPHKKNPRVVAVYKQESNNPSHLAVNVRVFALLLNAKDLDRHSSCFTFFSSHLHVRACPVRRRVRASVEKVCVGRSAA
jgi:hypothetical protein